jgi:transcriptional regulator with XRE-family HTH domain
VLRVLQAAREEAGLTQEQLALRLGVRPRMIFSYRDRIEVGKIKDDSVCSEDSGNLPQCVG